MKTTTDVDAPVQPAASASSTNQAALLAAAIIAPAILAACGGGGGGGGGGGSGSTDPGPANTFVSVKMAATAVGTTTVNSLATTAGAKEFSLSGSAEAGAVLKRDPGAAKPPEEYEFTITASDMASTVNAWIRVTVNPPPEDVLGASDTFSRQVRMFHSRIGLGASVSDLMRFLKTDYDTMVDTTLAEAVTAATHPVVAAPAWIDTKILSWTEYNALSAAAKQAYDDAKGPRIAELRRWWHQHLVKSPSPLMERMVLFWHNHFVTAVYDIFEPRLSWRYLQTLRTYAMGDFKAFVEAICRDVAMCYFLNNNDNTKYGPNENFARELMELFTLGEGIGYTEADIVQVARTFTGYHVTPNGAFEFRSDLHDDGTIIGKPYLDYLATAPGHSAAHRYGAPFDGMPVGQIGNTVVDLIFAIPDPGDGAYRRVAMYIAEKLWDEFIGGTPRDLPTVKAIAGAFQADWDIAAALEAMFKSAKFKDVAREGHLVRSPIELYVGFYRTLEIEPQSNGSWDSLVWMGDGGDQQLGQPPNVRGWLGGTSWITSKTYLNRGNNLSWKSWENRDLVPSYLFDALKLLLLPIPPVVEGTNIDAVISWGPMVNRLSACSRDPAIHLK